MMELTVGDFPGVLTLGFGPRFAGSDAGLESDKAKTLIMVEYSLPTSLN